MERIDILKTLKDIIKKTCPKKNIDLDKVTEEYSLKEDLGLDSIEVIVIALSIENEFGIEFSDYDVNTFKTVGNVITYIKEKLD